MNPTVLLMDDHAEVLEQIAELVRTKFEVVGECRDSRQFLSLVRATRPDVVVTDLSMPSIGGFDVLQLLLKEGLQTKVIFLTMHAEPSLMQRAFREGAAGFVRKSRAGQELLTAIESVLQGSSYGRAGELE